MSSRSYPGDAGDYPPVDRPVDEASDNLGPVRCEVRFSVVPAGAVGSTVAAVAAIAAAGIVS